MIITGTRVRGGRYYGGTGSASDAYFDLVALLLPGNGTNGAQNNTFQDSSTNAFTITRNGNTTQGTFSPFSQTGWSNYFDGSGDYLTLSSNTSMDFGTGNFTIEGWFYTGSKDISGGASRTIIGNSGNGYTMQVYITTSGYLTFGNTGSTFLQGSTDLADNAWHHFAIARKGTGTNEIAMWIDGVRVAQGTNSQNYTSGTIFLGSFDASNGFWNGYLSNLRIVKGTAVYDASNSTITVPTSPLTAITNTSLLTCQSNRFIDNSANAFAITVNGNTSVQAFAPFDPTADYSTTTVGGSAYFDGSGDNLTVADNAAFEFGSGSFTVEMWFYLGASGTNALVTKNRSGTEADGGLIIDVSPTTIRVYIDGNAGTTLVSNVSTTISLNTWYHLAVVRSVSGGTNNYVFLNGVAVGTSTTSTAFADNSQPLKIGTDNLSGSNYNQFTGYISNLRIVKGTAVYTSAFTPPTAPLTAIANTSLLLNYTNGGITDATAKNVLETVGSAQISTAQSKFGGSSIYFDGTGDWLVVPNNAFYTFGSGDFTIEFWWYPNTTADQNLISKWNSGTEWILQWRNAGNFRWAANGSVVRDATYTLSTGAWIHVAVSCASGNLRIFVNGTQIGTTATQSSITTTTEPVVIGAGQISTTPLVVNGYFDDVRITRFARYTANFTPPTAAFPTQ